jgi:hypothetical protein
VSEYCGSYPSSRHILRGLSKTAGLKSSEKDYLLQTFNIDKKISSDMSIYLYNGAVFSVIFFALFLIILIYLIWNNMKYI